MRTFDFQALNERADAVLEECSRRRLGLAHTMERFLPAVCGVIGAGAAELRTADESMTERAFSWGGGPFPPADAKGLVRSGGRLWVVQPLDVSGKKVGRAVFGFAADAANPAELKRAVGVVCEQLDGVLLSVQTASFKQGIVERIGRSLTRHVFDQAVDDAVAAFHDAVPFKMFTLVYADDDEQAGGMLYRVYEGRKCVRRTKGPRHAKLDALLSAEGKAAVEPGRDDVARALGSPGAVTCPLIASVAQPRSIGAAVVEVPQGLDTFGLDLLRIFANAVSQRLVDYNRERRHLSQFFSHDVIDELVGQGDYSRHLSPRVADIGLLYADINGFTKLCERALKRPDRIGEFVDLWSAEAVKIVWKNGGVFDKMVGDCVIAHFGPPFYRGKPKDLAQAALRSAFEIQRYTEKLGQQAEFKKLPKLAGLPGLGVAIGVNVCSAAVGLFGPNRDFTAFSRGMNETARLQSQAGFRETLIMEDAARLLGPRPHGVKLTDLREAAAKNVGKPLRFYTAQPS